ncbi:MAG: nitrous oxide reductase accessory protein NosL [Chitinophagales bacterium]
MNKRMSILTKVIIGICALSLIAVIFLPVWRIELTAPQYPEGLVLKIYANRLGGDVAVVNGLNHYIGMRSLHENDFVEFAVLPYILGTLIFFGLLCIFINREWFFLCWVGFFLLFAITAMIDFYRWEYNYGHNLNPEAPIQVPGMYYQPPLIGYKQLLNFGAFSIPGAGGWILFAIGLILTAMAIRMAIAIHRQSAQFSKAVIFLLAIGVSLMSACSTGPQPIQFGRNDCDFCKMTIEDERYGGEIITKKGKAYKFDDLHCLNGFLKSGSFNKNEMSHVYLVSFTTKGELLDAEKCLILKSQALKAPMGGDLAAFPDQASLDFFRKQFGGTMFSWDDVSK